MGFSGRCGQGGGNSLAGPFALVGLLTNCFEKAKKVHYFTFVFWEGDCFRVIIGSVLAGLSPWISSPIGKMSHSVSFIALRMPCFQLVFSQ